MSIKKKLILTFLVIVLLPMLAMGLFSQSLMRSAILDSYESRGKAEADRAAGATIKTLKDLAQNYKVDP